MKHYNPSISHDTVRLLNTKGESFEDVGDYLIPVLPIVPISHIARQATADATIYATPADADFYLVYAYIAHQSPVTAAGTGGYITATINGVTLRILEVLHPTLNASAENTQMSLSVPLKIDRGTNILVTGGVNNVVKGGIVGYLRQVQASYPT